MKLCSCRFRIMSIFALSLGLVLFVEPSVAQKHNEESIKPYKDNPYYWEYNGEPVLLLGGSKNDNLFQSPELKAHLNAISKAGGNYIRNTMSDRDEGNVYAYKKRADGKFDLSSWNDEYWDRFEKLLKWTEERDIIVQIEVWDRFDYSRDNWLTHPYNPKNNINYTYEESGFEPEYPKHPGANVQPFFFTTPKQHNNRLILSYQQQYVNKLLDYALQYPNVLYCMDNETSGEEAWSTYWANYIRERAESGGKLIQITEMWDNWDLKSDEHRRTLDHPERYDFADISQNNHQTDETHWVNFQWVRRYVENRPRPLNSVKIYGANDGRHGGTDLDAVEKFWRLIFGGAASARFHRPSSGIGFGQLARTQLKSARMLLKETDIFTMQPDVEHTKLGKREKDEAYLIHNTSQNSTSNTDTNQHYAVYFTDGGSVDLMLPASNKKWRLRWLDIANSRWTYTDEISTTAALDTITLEPPQKGPWIVVLNP